MERKKLPSMTSLQVLLAVSERGSTSAASEVLALTQSAVSKQLIAIEQLVGASLFVRKPSGMILTDVGKIYVEQARVVMKAMDDAALNVVRLKPHNNVLRLLVPPIFGDRWLLPRFADFSDANPEIDVQFSAYVSNSQSEAPDGEFRYVVQPGDGEEGTYLFGNVVCLVASASYWQKLGAPRTIEEASRGVILEHPQTPVHWHLYAKANGKDALSAQHITRFGYYSMVIRAALAGQGMALIPRGLIREDLATGRLINPNGLGYRSPFGYWFIKPNKLHRAKSTRIFEKWLEAEIIKVDD